MASVDGAAKSDVGGLPDPDWYLDNVLVFAEPGRGGRVDRGPAAVWQEWWRGHLGVREPVVTAAGQGFVVSAAQLAGLGTTRATARHAVRIGRWSSPCPGTVAVIAVADGADAHTVDRRRHALRAAAAVLRRPGKTVSARSAAVLHGLPTLKIPARAEVTSPCDAGLGASSVHTFGAALAPGSVTTWFGVAVTDVARTLVDLARHDRRDGLLACDAALRERLVDPAQLDRALDDAIGWPGVRQARAVLALGSPLSESPLESLARLAMHDSGFPAPQQQVEICGYRVDLLLAEQRLVIEADGRVKYTDDELWREKQREHVLRNAGFAVERVIWSDVQRHWPTTALRLRAAMRAADPPSPFPWS